MRRTLIERLNAWKSSPTRQPLILRGARQVGKTWLLKEFGRTAYESCAYVNFDANSRMQRLFAEDLEPARIIEGLQIECRQTIVSGKTLLVFDEVQEAPKALASLKYFAEQAPEQHIVAAGSLLGIALHQGASFPVGKVAFLDLRPLSFREFLLATGEERLLAPLEREDWSLVGALRERYVACLRQYFFTGGMPEAVLAFAARRDLTEVSEVQSRLLAAYEQDFSKHAPHAVVPRIRLLWNSLPAQLARENRKFVYGVVKPGARAREYELALAWLADCGLVHQVQRISRPLPPLRAQADFSSFKLFHLDVGLLARMCNLDPQALLDGDRLFREFSGALTEQYVLQELLTLADLELCYWSADRGAAEVDFVAQRAGRIWPIEVKAGENRQAKSLKVYREKFTPAISLRTSLADFRRESWLCNVPLYAVGAFLANPERP